MAECPILTWWACSARNNRGSGAALDIRSIVSSGTEIPPFDLLLAGFPCQPFSIAGVSKKNALNQPHGFLDQTRGTLFRDICDIVRRDKPAAFLLENVKHLKGHDGGNTYRVIEGSFTELGYAIRSCVIDSKPWVPQHRERIFMFGMREDIDAPGFHGATLKQGVLKSAPLLGPNLAEILHPEDGSEAAEFPFTVGKFARVHERYTLTPKVWAYLQHHAKFHRDRGNGFGYGLFGPDHVARTLSARYHKDGSEILIDRGHGSLPRRLTPRECSRLMGFDRPGAPFAIPVSDSQAYRQFGNSVVVPLVEAIARVIVPLLMRQVSKAG